MIPDEFIRLLDAEIQESSDKWDAEMDAYRSAYLEGKVNTLRTIKHTYTQMQSSLYLSFVANSLQPIENQSTEDKSSTFTDGLE